MSDYQDSNGEWRHGTSGERISAPNSTPSGGGSHELGDFVGNVAEGAGNLIGGMIGNAMAKKANREALQEMILMYKANATKAAKPFFEEAKKFDQSGDLNQAVKNYEEAIRKAKAEFPDWQEWKKEFGYKYAPCDYIPEILYRLVEIYFIEKKKYTRIIELAYGMKDEDGGDKYNHIQAYLAESYYRLMETQKDEKREETKKLAVDAFQDIIISNDNVLVEKIDDGKDVYSLELAKSRLESMGAAHKGLVKWHHAAIIGAIEGAVLGFLIGGVIGAIIGIIPGLLILGIALPWYSQLGYKGIVYFFLTPIVGAAALYTYSMWINLDGGQSHLTFILAPIFGFLAGLFFGKIRVVRIGLVALLVVFGALLISANNSASVAEFPAEFIGTWKDVDSKNTVIFASKSVEYTQFYDKHIDTDRFEVVKVSKNKYTLQKISGIGRYTYTMDLADDKLVISGYPESYGGTWVKQY